MIVKQFEMGDLKNFTPKNEGIADIEGDLEYYMRSQNTDLMTLLKDEGVICIAGVTHLRLGVGEVWLVPSILVDKYKFEFFKSVYKLIYEFVFPQLKFHRVTMAIKEGWEQGYKWAKALGFKYESMMEAYDSNYENQACFVRIEKWQNQQQ